MRSYYFLQQLIKLPFVEEVWLFGSRARGDNTERSDLDIAIVCPLASEKEWQDIVAVVEDADTLLKIDCVRFDALEERSAFRSNILGHKKILYQKKGGYMDPLLWKDQFEALGNAISRLKEVLTHEELDKIEYMQDAAIQRFVFVIELFWKMLKKCLAYEKVESSTPRDVLKKAFQFEIIDNEEAWLAMLDDRNFTSHVYKQEEAKKIFERIKVYCPVLEKAYEKLKGRLGYGVNT